MRATTTLVLLSALLCCQLCGAVAIPCPAAVPLAPSLLPSNVIDVSLQGQERTGLFFLKKKALTAAALPYPTAVQACSRVGVRATT